MTQFFTAAVLFLVVTSISFANSNQHICHYSEGENVGGYEALALNLEAGHAIVGDGTDGLVIPLVSISGKGASYYFSPDKSGHPIIHFELEKNPGSDKPSGIARVKRWGETPGAGFKYSTFVCKKK